MYTFAFSISVYLHFNIRYVDVIYHKLCTYIYIYICIYMLQMKYR